MKSCSQGIFLVANDYVIDQTIALLNSIHHNFGTKYPIAIVPYDNDFEKIRALIKSRENTFAIEDSDMIERWENFAKECWSLHPKAAASLKKNGVLGCHAIGVNRRFCAFDPESPFEEFVYIDNDALLLHGIDEVFEALKTFDFIHYDFQFKHPQHVFQLDTPKAKKILPQEVIDKDIFCTGFFASKRGLIGKSEKDRVTASLKSGEHRALYSRAPVNSLLNFIVLKNQISKVNLVNHWPRNCVTGNAVTSSHFNYKDGQMYDKEARLVYLHYIGISARAFQRLCAGENLDIPYREAFLHYRFLNEKKNRPAYTGKVKPLDHSVSLWNRLKQKLIR